ncbi:hypothetical protein MTTB_p010 (plasmid) [Methanothermobacter tenebrarum]|uniref:Uncharacterized protein n=1 Tax=Methanothermobacter tenebrarum TaxID=680118 RepID=A0ABM7YFA6_9EURY|nr:hypothetical protein MTTB_p010 [Methanothermobacter tenebrarum]
MPMFPTISYVTYHIYTLLHKTPYKRKRLSLLEKIWGEGGAFASLRGGDAKKADPLPPGIIFVFTL